MPSNNVPLTERVQSSYQRLSSASTELNTTSDELGKVIGALESALKKLNLGISTWVSFSTWNAPDGDGYFREDLGYDKINGKWGICLRTSSGRHSEPDYAEVEYWLFNDAPRKLRLSGIENIPELIEQLVEDTEDTTKRIKAKLGQAKELTAAINAIADKK
jgi:methyl-accepting chemotaxis protein